MVDCISQELSSRSDELIRVPIQTVYFGGGTPSLLDKQQFQKLFETIHSHFDLADEVEITLEANPDDISEEKVREWVEIGFNRLSIGLQSFKSSDLKWMNRAHNKNEALNCVRIAQKAGIQNISIDLIYGLPELSLEEWKNHIQIAVGLDVQHISAYCLTVEENTSLHKAVEQGKIHPASNEVQAEQFEVLVSELKAAKFEQYEISNFAKDNQYARHNTHYWMGIPYLGVGPSAHSFFPGERRFNVANNQAYMKGLDSAVDYYEKEILSPEDQFNELLMTGLRTKWGVNVSALNALGCRTNSFDKTLSGYFLSDEIIEQEGQLILTDKGKLRADAIASDLFVLKNS